MSSKTITRIVVGLFPLTWYFVSWGLFSDFHTQFPDLPPSYFMSGMMGFLLALMLTGFIRAFIHIVIEGKEI